MKNKIRYGLLIFLLSSLPSWGIAQAKGDYAQTLTQLQVRLDKGEVLALRDLGTLLDEDTFIIWEKDGDLKRNRLGSLVAELLKEYLLLEDASVLADKNLRSKPFLTFYYTHADALKFSEWAHKFVLAPLKESKSIYRLGQKISINLSPNGLLSQYRRNLRTARTNESYKEMATYIQEIAALQTEASYQFIQECANGRHWSYGNNPYEVYTFEKIIFALRHYPNPQSLLKIHSLLHQIEADSANRIDPQLVAIALQSISNHPMDTRGMNAKAIAQAYRNLINQYGSWEKMRKAGYQKIFPYNEAYFQDELDYYGKMLNNSLNYYWIKQHILLDIQQNRQPKVLLYLAAQIYQNQAKQSFFWHRDFKILSLIRSLLKNEIWVKDELGNWVTDAEKDEKTALNYLIYWIKHYQDYQWNENLSLFVNTQEAVPEPDDYDGIFQELFSNSALKSFQALKRLSEASSEEVLARIPSHYEPIVRIGRNDMLPPFPFKALQQSVKIRQFCQANQIPYSLPDVWQRSLNRLKNKLAQPVRYQIENRLIDSLDLSHTTALELIGSLYQHKEKWFFNQSLSRILEKLYAKHWPALLQDENQLRLYLKKSYLLAKLGASGTCTQYLDKFFKNKESSTTQLTALWDKEKDPDILYQLARLLPRPILSLDKKLEVFLQNPQYARINIEELYIQHPDDFQELVQRIQNNQNPKGRKRLFELLELRPSLAQVPFLMQLLADSRAIEQRYIGGRILVFTVADYAVFQLERLFKHSYSDEKDFYDCRDRRQFLFRRTGQNWQALWQRDSINYKNWEQFFFEDKIKRLQNTQSLNVNLMNNILNSPFYQASIHEPLINKHLSQVYPQADLKFFDFQRPLKMEDFKQWKTYGENMGILLHLLKHLEINAKQSEEVLVHLKNKTQNLDQNLQGKIFQELLAESDLIYWMEAFSDQDFISQVDKALATQYQGYATTTWEDEQLEAWRFLVRHSDKSLSERVRQVRALRDEDKQLDMLDMILTHSHYEGLSELLKSYNSFKLPSYPYRIQFDVRTYLREDVGLPIYDLQAGDIDRILKRYAQLNPLDFYREFCEVFSLEVFYEDSTLNFTKIYEVLQGDMVQEFAALSPLKRRDQVYLMIRLLEIYFDTRLGFPRNMQHGSSMIIKINFQDRVKKWQAFLEQMLLHNDQ